MPTYLNEIAQELMNDHPGIDDIKIAFELTESFYRVMRKRLIKHGILHIENVGKLEVKHYKGTDNKKDPRSGIRFKISPRNIVKYTASPSLVKMVNMAREPRQRVKTAS